jgi:hypothetical protein
VIRGWRVLVPALLLVGSACARASEGEADGGTDPAHAPVSVEVRNQYALPVEIYVFGSGITQRLGTVHPGMNARFGVPQNLVGGRSVRFEARAGDDSRPFQSEDMLLAPGTVVDFAVSPQLFNSTVTLRK